VYRNDTLKVMNVTTDVSYTVPSDFIFAPGSYNSVPPVSGGINTSAEYVMMTAATNGLVEYNKTKKPDAGLMNITFSIVSVPASGTTFSGFFELYAPEPPSTSGDTWTVDANVNDNALTTTGGSYSVSTSASDGGNGGGGGGGSSGGAFPFEIIAAVVIVVVAAVAVGVLLLRRRKKSA